MRRVIVPALLAVAMVAGTSANAHAFGLFSNLCGNGCDSGCAEPTCGCEVIAEPACGCEAPAPCGCDIVEPACGCEPACCDSGCGIGKGGLLKKLFSKHHGCDSGCAVVEPACGCEIVEPACGCEVAPACDSGCGCGPKPFGLLKKLFSKKHSCCDSGCAVVEPTCGCEVIEPSCGFEVAAPACGCN